MSEDDPVRRIVVTDAGVTVESVAPLRPASDEVAVSATVVGVCGSDVHAVHARHPFIRLPYHPGHEVVGVVTELGSDVTTVRPGQRVVVEPTLPCWSCKMCSSGRENLCEQLQFFGCGYEQGGMAEVFTVPANRLHVVPEPLDLRAAALIEPLATPVHAARLAGSVAGKTVVVLGAGTIGLLLLSVVLAQRPASVVVTDVRADKRARARRLGAHSTVDATDPDLVATVRRELGQSADVVFDCVAIQQTVTTAIELADKGGTVVIVGVPSAEVSIALPIVQDHQIRIQGSATYLPEDFADAIAMLSDGLVDPDEIITAEYPLAAAAEAFAAASDGGNVKVVVRSGNAPATT